MIAVVSRLTSLGAADLTRNDFTPDYMSASALIHGSDPYAPLSSLVHYLGPNSSYFGASTFEARNVHTPLDVVLIVPLAVFPYRVARILWLLIMAILAALATGLTVRTFGVSREWSTVCAIGVLALPIFQKDLVYAQSHGLLLLLFVSAWLALRKGKDRGTGFALGAASAWKLFPALMVIPLIRLKRWRALGWMIGSGAVIGLTSALIVGLTPTREFISRATPKNFEFWRSAPMNLSAAGIAYRWLTRSYWRPQGVNVPALATTVVVILIALCVVAMFATPGRRMGIYWGVMPFLLLVSPLAWDTYLVLMTPFLIGALVHGGRRAPTMIALAIIAIGIPPWLPGPPALVPDIAQLLGYALPTYALIVLGISEWRSADNEQLVYSV